MPPRRPSPFSALLCLVAASAACFPGARLLPPPAQVHAELGPTKAVLAAPLAAGPLAVVFAAPSGEADNATSVTIVFSKSMRRLGADPREPRPPVVMKPEVPGSWRWIGSSTLRFDPEKRLSRAKTYSVEVPVGTRAEDGSTLEAPFAFSFSTARPALTGSEPQDGAKAVSPDAPITLIFAEPVLAKEIERAVSLGAPSAPNARGPLPFSIVEVEGERVVLAPRQPLPRNTDIKVHIDASLRGAEGDLPAGKAADIHFHTVGPFAVDSLACAPHPVEKGACDPAEGSISLVFTTPANPDPVGRALSITPAPDWFNVEATYSEGDGDGSRAFRLSGNFEPGKTYTVELQNRAAGHAVSDIHGQSLAKAEKRVFRFGDLPANVLFGADGTYWMPEKRFLPLGVTNAEDTTVSILPLTAAQVLARLAGGAWPAPALSAPRTFAAPAGKRNEAAWSRFRVEDLLPTPTTSGPVLVRASYRASPKPERSTEDREIQLTDLGLLGKVTKDEALLWVTSLSNGTLAKNARVEAFYIRNHEKPLPLGVASADAGGLASVPLKIPRDTRQKEDHGGPEGRAELALFAKSGDDWAYQTIRMPRPPDAVGDLFTGRGIYRPGERVEVKGILRAPQTTGLTTPAGREIELRVLGPTDEVVSSSRQTLSRFGTFSALVPLAESAPLGAYFVEAELDGAIVRTRLSVDEYKPVESQVSATIDAPSHHTGERMFCAARGAFLNGAAMAGARASLVVTRNSTHLSVANLQGFTFTEHDATTASGQIAQGAGKLDGAGSFSLPVTLTLPGQTGPELVVCSVEVRGQDGEVQTGEASTIVHGADLYIALEEDSRYGLTAGDPIHPRVLAVTPEGARLEKPVRVEVFRRIHEGAQGLRDVSLGHCDVKTREEPLGCGFFVPKDEPTAEEEIVVRATTVDSHGRRIAASYAERLNPAPTYVKAEPAPPPPTTTTTTPPPAPPAPDPPRLVVKVGERFRVGEKARLELDSPYTVASSALVTVEREGFLLKQVIPLAPVGKKTTFDFVITEAMIPNAVVTVTAIDKERSETQEDDFSVDASDRKLNVEVRPSKTKTTPGDTIDVEVVVKDAAGKPVPNAEVTLWGEDEGSLQLTYYRTPDPWYHLYRERNARVSMDDGRNHLLRTWSGGHRTKPPQVRMGATSVGPHRGDFRQTVAFFPDLVTDEKGRVKRRITLPDGLTAYRFMAVAMTERDLTGSNEAEVATWRRLMARPTLPRVLRVGDEFEADVTLSSLELSPGTVTVTTKTSGLEAAGPLRKTAALDPEHPATLFFPFRAARAGKVVFSLDASLVPPGQTNAETDGVDLTGEIVAPEALEAAALAGETTSAVAERLADLGALRVDTGGLSISLSTSPLAGLASGIEQLVEYPHGCTEQTVSRMVPLLALRDLAASLGVSVLPSQTTGARGESADEALLRGTRTVLANQKRDGSFGLWAESIEGDPWITAYALWGLGEAGRRGLPVPKEALDRGFGFLEPNLGAVGPSSSPEALGQAAFTLAVLADNGRADENAVKALLAERERLPLFARALVLRTLATTGRAKAPEARALLASLEASIRVEGASASVESPPALASSRRAFDSAIRTTAMVLRALVAVDPAHPLAGKLARGLVDSRSNGVFPTTHDAAWALLALDAYRRVAPFPTGELDARVFLGNTLLADQHLGGSTLQKTIFLPMADLVRAPGAPLTLATSDGTRLHYEAILHYSRKDAPREPVERGFFVTKSFRPVAELGGPVAAASESPANIAPGDVIVCEIEVVTTSPRHWVVLSDPLPGGLEAIRMEHRRGGSWLSTLEETPANRRELRDDHVAYFIDVLPAGVTRFRYLARATHAGTFSAPPTRVEEMYSPETYGRTAGSVFRVGVR